MCDDECPHCGASDRSPTDSEDISAFFQRNEKGNYDIYYSPPVAGYDPEYTILATTAYRNLAIIIEKIAFDLSKPL